MTERRPVFGKILHANDGSEYALAIAKQNNSELHIVSVEEIDYVPEQIEEVREEAGNAARWFRASFNAHGNGRHVVAGHPVRTIINLAAELKADLLVIGARGHSALCERLVGSRAERIIQLAHCPVLVMK